METTEKKQALTVNDIARAPGAGKIDPIYYNPRCPHNQKFNISGKKKK